MKTESFMAGLLVLLLGGTPPAWSADAGPSPVPAPEAHVRIDASTVVLGKRFVLRVTINHAAQTSVDLPGSLVLGTAFEEVTRSRQQAVDKDGQIRTEFALELLPFELGQKEVPPLPITYVQGGHVSELRTAPLPVVVASNSTAPPAPETLRAIAPPVPVRREDWRLVYGLAGAVGLLLAFYLIHKIRRALLRWRAVRAGALDGMVEPLLPEDEEALTRLAALEASGALEADDLKPAYHTMSEILRVYLGRRYAFPAIDSTTEEIRQQIGMAAGGAWIIAAAVLNWLEAADLVKFANAPASPEEARKACEGVREIVAQTRRTLATTPEPEPKAERAPEPVTAEPAPAAEPRSEEHVQK